MARVTSLEERMLIWSMAEAGCSDNEIATRLGWSIPTVRKWRRRAQREGRSGLVSHMGRPATGALSSFPPPIRDAVHQHRVAHPGWGPLTLVTELQLDPELQNVKHPSRASVGRYLHEQGLTRTYERHTELPDTKTPRATGVHDVWEMDARGHAYVPDVGVIALVNVNDCYSHLRVLSYPLQVGGKRWQRHPNTEDYQLILRLAFRDWGLPQQLQVDRSSVFYDNVTKSPFPTRAHLWLRALGVRLRLGRPNRPTDQGMTERSHELWANQVLEGQTFADWLTLYQALRQRRDFLNRHLPCASLQHQPILQAFPSATHSRRTYDPQYEEAMLDLQRVWDYLAEGQWFRLLSKDGTFSLGGYVYYLGATWARQQIEIRFDPSDHCLYCYSENEELLGHKPIQGVTHESLMGDLALGVSLPFFQFALPFSREEQEVIRLFETLPV